MESNGRRAVLLLEDGEIFYGENHGAKTTVFGELVFNTAMLGYEEVLSDPSYAGQIVVFTTPHLGVTGITEEDAESTLFFAEGFVCRDFVSRPDNRRAFFSVEESLSKKGKPALSGIDTRRLTLHLRSKGCLRAVLCSDGTPLSSLQQSLQRYVSVPLPSLLHDSREPYRGPWVPISTEVLRRQAAHHAARRGREPLPVVVIDFGIKKGILDNLVQVGLEPYCVSPFASLAEINSFAPKGLFLSNGPGDPTEVAQKTPVLNLLSALTPTLPTFGICMGHQVLALRYGAKIRKLKFGHHAVNHPVRDLSEKHLGYVTSQNHNYVAEIKDCPELEETYVHLNDGTLAGMRHKKHPMFSVQFHPECNPGPRDALGLFENFAKLVEEKNHTKEGNKP
jgi:carbamoyl-phosphate synthase small subunit